MPHMQASVHPGYDTFADPKTGNMLLYYRACQDPRWTGLQVI